MRPLRQGMVVLIPTSTLESKGLIWSRVASTQLPLELARNIVTNHCHRIAEGEAKLFLQSDETRGLRVLSSTALLTHEVHESIAIPQGDWIVRVRREYILGFRNYWNADSIDEDEYRYEPHGWSAWEY